MPLALARRVSVTLYLETCKSWSTAGVYTTTALFHRFKEGPRGADGILADQVCTWHQLGERSVNMLKYMATIQRDLNRLEEQVFMNLMKFNKDICKDLPWKLKNLCS